MTNLFKQSDKRIAKKTKTKKQKAYKPRVSANVTGKAGAFLPQSVSTVLTYCDSGTLQATLGIMSDKLWNMNSVYSPENAGGGHQPLGHDQYAALYNRYRVDKLEVWLECNKSTESSVGFAALVATNTATAITNPTSVVQEQAFSNWKTLSYSTAGSGTKVVLKRTYDLCNVTGVTREKYRTDDRYSSLVNDNPAELIILHQVSADLLGASTTAYIYTIKFKYHTTWFDPKIVAQS